MRIHSLMLAGLLSLPLPVWADYDIERIKATLDKHQQTFQIRDWQRDDLSGQLTAASDVKGLSITLDIQLAVMSEPFINKLMYGPAKKRCTHFGEIGLDAHEQAELIEISETVAKAARRHALSHYTINNVRFEVLPKVVGPFVRLVCRVRPAP